MTFANASRTPFVSLRHAQTGRIGEGGRLPSGWSSEHAVEVDVIDVHSPPPPWLTLRFRFDADLPGDYAGICLSAYLPVAAHRVVALSGEFAFEEQLNVEVACLVLREWESGGLLAAQSLQTFAADDAAGPRSLIHRMSGAERLAQPVLLVKRQARARGAVTITMRGLAFGRVDEYPEWLEVDAGG